MSKNSLEFNKKYGVSADLVAKLKLSKDEKISNNIAGKPKILLLEIFKRFFTNPVVVIAFIIFIAIILTSVFVSLFSQYPAVKPIDANLPNDQKVANFESLPPILNPIKETSDISVIRNISRWLNPRFDYHQYLKPYTQGYEVIVPGSIVKYNAYLYFEGAQLQAKLINFVNQNGKQALANVNIDQMITSIPKLQTFLGTNNLGADIWTTVWKGTLESLWIAFFVATVEIIIGVFVGAYLGFNAGKWLDTFMMRLIEIFTSPPSIIWLLLFVTIWGTNPWVLIGGLLFVGWTGPIGVTRLFIITVKDEEYIMAAKSIGASESRQIFLHALPAILGKIAMSYVRRIPSVILSIASLAFLGFFKDNDSANLGKFMLDNLEASKQNPWLLILPALILLGISISLQFTAIGLHDALDPKVIKVKR
ncbi:ABC transporter permease [Mycoplasmopsis phocirhinis]|uniref:ABC transporter permease n=1 Tax=Mycoplasmopsis phocirhinis TaxID=142650 RepID=A0A4P6MPR9_9BACT|nr:ABC transporter permease [Mycoplasmopsis phocirhinis]QBF34736.1 ABC transporter permease [Mycoplasmopsis phocirhinis]